MSASIDLVTCSLSVPIPWAASPVPVTQATKAMVSPARVSFLHDKFPLENRQKCSGSDCVLFLVLTTRKNPKSQFFDTKKVCHWFGSCVPSRTHFRPPPSWFGFRFPACLSSHLSVGTTPECMQQHSSSLSIHWRGSHSRPS